MGWWRADLGIPKRIRTSWGTLLLDYTILRESQPMANMSAYPADINTDEAEVVEVEDDRLGFSKKVMYRLPYTLTEDMVMLLIPHVDVMENKKDGIVLDLFYVNVDFDVKKREYYDNYKDNV